MKDETIETTPEPLPEGDKPASVALVTSPGPIIKHPPTSGEQTAQQMRIIEVSEALVPAYQRASMLELTDDEIAKLTKPFPDEAVEVRPHDGLIWIPHIHISNRLNEVLRPGKWSLICRRHWLEASTMYGEYILLIRGYYVGESVGGHPYIATNPKLNYSDALEATAGEALRRICGKRLSCGSQVWDPTYANTWCEKYRGFDHSTKKFFKKSPKAANNGGKKAKEPAEPTAEEKKAKAAKFAEMLAADKDLATQFCIDRGWILPTHESLADVPYHHLPKTMGEFKKFKREMEQWAKDGVVPGISAPAPAEDPEIDEDDGGDNDDAEWRSFEMPFGKQKGTRLEDLEKKYLYGFWANYTVEETFVGSDGKTHKQKPETLALNRKFRQMLDEAGDHYEFTLPK